MATYTKTTDFLAKDSLPLNNAGKYVKGSEIDTEFNNLATADADNLKVSALGTGVETALGVNIGSAGAPVVNGGALGTPSSGTLTNATGLPAAGVTGTALVAAAIGTTVQAYDATLTAFAGGLTAAGKIPYATALNTLGELNFKDEDDMVSDSATAVPSQQSVKAYVTSSVAGRLPTTGGSMTGPINEARGSLAMHATTMNLWAQPNTIDGTGSAVTITAIANAPQAGAKRTLYPITGTVITNGATFAVDGNANYTTAAGDALEFEAVTTSTYKVHITKKDGTAVAVGTQTDKIQSVDYALAANALTLKLNPTSLDFRSTTLTSGAPTTVTNAAQINTTISSGSTGGTVSAVQSNIYILAINNAGTMELAWCNASGGINLDETTLISTTAEGGAGAADSATVIYSTTARSNVAFRVVGLFRSTQTTAGTWAQTPSLVQGYGGQALAAMSSLGYGQTWQVVTGSRSSGVTYYNTTGKPIFVQAALNALGNITPTVDGVSLGGQYVNCHFIVHSGTSYSITAASLAFWNELR